MDDFYDGEMEREHAAWIAEQQTREVEIAYQEWCEREHRHYERRTTKSFAKGGVPCGR